MKIGMPIPYAGAGFKDIASKVVEFEAVGLDVILLPEVYTFDSVSQLGYLAAVTDRVELCSNILNLYSRTPALLAMTAAGLDYVSDGRFVMGIGASGPQVIEGWHGVKYDTPLARTREIIEIMRTVWRREKIDHHGAKYDIPLTKENGGSGLGVSLKLINHPVRANIPVVLAALGPKNVELAAELFEAWEPIFFSPEHADLAFGESLTAGAAKRSADLPPLQINVDTRIMITEDAEEKATAEQAVRDNLALYIGGMGARGKNFYNDLTVRFGYADEAALMQDLYLSGKKAEAAAAVPQGLIDATQLIGSKSFVAERVAAFAEAGVAALNAAPLAPTHERQVADIKALKEIAG